ncbi:MAG: NAD(P)H-quinone oxidoreductase [Actinomycetales bacterium]|nr:NAD(P)H-quinone oxidoreductase [Actinomycetales bacterium]
MRAVIALEPGDPDVLSIQETDQPIPADGEVLIRVAAAGVNRADLLQTAGHYPPPPGISEVIGLEVSGVIEACGPGVTEWQPGERVMALLSGGGYAEFVVVPAGQVAHVPQGVSLVAAAGIMETLATVWSNVFMTAGLQPGQTLLVHGGGSGIGTMATVVAKARGARVITTVGSERKAEASRELGADLVINYRDEDFVEHVKAAGGADVILDIMGAKYLSRNVTALKTGGHLVVIGLQGGVKGELNLAALLNKRASVTATSLRFRPVVEKSAIVAELAEQVLPLFASGQLAPVIDTTFGMDQATEALEHVAASAHIGKVVLLIDHALVEA